MKKPLRSSSWIGLSVVLMIAVFQVSYARPPADYSWSGGDLGFSGYVNTITGTSQDHLYFVNGGLIYQWNSGSASWLEMSSFSNFVNNSDTFNAANVIAAVGNQIYVGSVSSSSGGRTAYFNGSNWSEATSGSTVAYSGVFAYEIQVNTGSGNVGQVVNIYARGAGRIYRLVDGVGASSPSQTGPAYTGGNIAWEGISGSPADNIIWAVGQGSQIGRSTNSGRGNTWSAVNAPVANTTFGAVHVLNGDTAIVGSRAIDGGTVGVWYTTNAGETWVNTGLGATTSVLDVYATSLEDIWAVGNGFALHYDGNTWNSFAELVGIQSTDQLRTIHVLGDQIWIGGRNAAGNAVLYTGVIPEPACVGLIIGVLGMVVFRCQRVRGKLSDLTGIHR